MQTFTYFIPAPPERKQGYREKSFDQIIQKLTKMDFEIIDIKTQAINNDSKSGMWAIVTMRPMTKKANELSISDFPSDGDSIMDKSQISPTEFTQNLAHFPTKNDNQDHKIVLDTPIDGIELPKDLETDDKDEIEGIYYID